uniref:Ycf1 n=1 Tax=Dumortiera hirsuta TaxID=56917 RepID=A0A346M0R6_DUMHI|nr:Ycf1 [Dumortiera hirsuta]AXQ02611.1 Ycf1 [Dumortiera hirsuta]
MILISQAYVFQKVWEIKTKNKSYLKCLLKYWTSHLCIKKNFQSFLSNQGIIGSIKLQNFKEENWKEWLKCFNRYNFSSKEWSKITPQQWRNKVTQHWKKKENQNLNTNQQNNKISTFINTFLLEQIKKRNKQFKQNCLIYSCFDFKKNSIIRKFLNFKRKKIYNNIIINKIQKIYFIYNKKEKYLDLFSEKQNIFFEYNLLLWLIPEFIEEKNKYQNKKISLLKNSIIKENNKKIIQNPKLFRKREFNQSIRQWRWKSKSLEKKFKKLGNMASLMTFMQNKENIITLSSKMREDLELFHLFFRRNTSINQLSINSEHRLARLLDDQVLMYKMVSTFLNLKYRFKQISILDNLDDFLEMQFFENKEKNNFFFFNSFNIENILLPKRRRKLRILNSLTSKNKKNTQFNEKFFKKNSSKNKMKKIKRFIWASYRFEDLACMNRFWFNTINGSRFSLLRFRMYPSLLT